MESLRTPELSKVVSTFEPQGSIGEVRKHARREDLVGISDALEEGLGGVGSLTCGKEQGVVFSMSSELSTQPASFETASTEACSAPNDGKDVSFHMGRVPRSPDKLELAVQPSFLAGVPSSQDQQDAPLPTLEADEGRESKSETKLQKSIKRKKQKSTESVGSKKRRKGQFVVADIEAAVGMTVSAAEAMVVAHIMADVSIDQMTRHSIALEAALSLRNARQVWGLDVYDLGEEDSRPEESEWEHLDDESMQQAFEDVGLMVSSAQTKWQLVDFHTEKVDLDQQKAVVSAEALHTSTSPLEKAGSFNPDGHMVVNMIQVSTCRVQVQHDSLGEETEGFTSQVPIPNKDGYRANAELHLNDSVIIPGSDLMGSNNVFTSRPLEEKEGKSLSLHNTQTETLRAGATHSNFENGSSCQNAATTHEDKQHIVTRSNSTETLDFEGQSVIVHKTVVTDGGPHVMETRSYCTEPSDTKAKGTKACQEAGPAEDVRLRDTGDSFTEPSSSLGAMVSELNCRYLSPCKSPTTVKAMTVESPTTEFISPFTSRWLGGWTAQQDANRMVEVLKRAPRGFFPPSVNDIGSEDAMPEQNAFFLRQKSTFEEEAFSKQIASGSVREVASPQQKGESSCELIKPASIQRNSPFSEACLDDPHLSVIDPLCSFVPCSISPPADLCLDSTCKDLTDSKLAATVEACARAAMDIVDIRRQADSEVATVPKGSDFSLQPCGRGGIDSLVEQNTQKLRTCTANQRLPGSTAKRTSASMRTFSRTVDPLSVLLHAVDLAGKSLPREGTSIHGPIMDSLDHTSSSPTNGAAGHSFERSVLQVEQACGSNFTEVVPMDVDMHVPFNLEAVPDVLEDSLSPKKKGLHEDGKNTTDPNFWACSNLSDSPPLLWPGGKKRRMTACRVIDSNSIESLPGNFATSFLSDHEHGELGERSTDDDVEHPLHCVKVGQHTLNRERRSSTRNTLRKQCQDEKSLFKGLEFLLTGFDAKKKEKLIKTIEQLGGVVLPDIPAFSPKQRYKRRGVDFGARNPPLVIAVQQVRTPKFLYGCAVDSIFLRSDWIYASLSAKTCLPYRLYLLKEPRSGCEPQQEDGRESWSSKAPLFGGVTFFFHGPPEFSSQFSTLAKHAGGRVLRKLVEKENALKQKPIGYVVTEGPSKLPRDLRRIAADMELIVVDAEWMMQSLVCGKVLPSSIGPSKSTQQSSSSKKCQGETSAAKKQISRKHSGQADGDSSHVQSVQRVKDCAVNNVKQCYLHSAAKKAVEHSQVVTWLGKGFTSRPQVPLLAVGIMGPYSEVMRSKRLSKRHLCYEAFLFNGVEYFLGDNVEMQSSNVEGVAEVVRIEGIWCEEEKRPQIRAFHQGIRKQAPNTLMLHCRRFYRPSATGFPESSTDELYLSNHPDNSFKSSNIVRKVRVALEVSGEAVQCSNWNAKPTGSSTLESELVTADYKCRFFYDHIRESLHLIKLCAS